MKEGPHVDIIDERDSPNNRGKVFLKIAFVIFAISIPSGTALSAGFVDAVIQRESTNNYSAASPTTSALGGGQILFGTAVGAGIVGGRSSGGTGLSGWNNAQWNTPFAQKWGISSTQDFLNNHLAQQDAIRSVAAMNYRGLGDTSNLLGVTKNGVTMNQATLMECAYTLGGGGCRAYLTNTGLGDKSAEYFQNQAAANRLDQRMSSAASLDVSDITGQAMTPGGGTAVSPTTGQLLPGVTPAIAGLYCDPQILSAIQTLGAQEVDRRMALALDGRTGFSTLNGNGVLAAAGLGSGTFGAPGSPGSVGGGGTSFFSMSCLDRLMNSGVGGLANIFNPPSWGEIQRLLLTAASNFVCSKANQLFQTVTQPLSQALYRSVSVDGFSPGMGQVLNQLGLPSSMSIGGRVGIVPGPDGPMVPLEDRFNLMMGQGGNSYSVGSGGSSLFGGDSLTNMPTRLFGPSPNSDSGAGYIPGALPSADGSTDFINGPSSSSSSSSSGIVGNNWQQYVGGNQVLDGQCAKLVQQVAPVGLTNTWRAGAAVVGNNNLVPGTALAIMDSNGTYGNHFQDGGLSHAVIYVGMDSSGNPKVLEQYVNGGSPRITTLDGRNKMYSASSYSVITH